MKKLVLGLAFAVALTGSLAAQTTSSTTTTTASSDGVTKTTETTTESTGTITEYSPGASFVLNTGAGEPVHYRFGKHVEYVTPDGKVIESSHVRKDARVRVHYAREGGDMLVDKVIVLP